VVAYVIASVLLLVITYHLIKSLIASVQLHQLRSSYKSNNLHYTKMYKCESCKSIWKSDPRSINAGICYGCLKKGEK
jgi:hypothetical protein